MDKNIKMSEKDLKKAKRNILQIKKEIKFNINSILRAKRYFCATFSNVKYRSSFYKTEKFVSNQKELLLILKRFVRNKAYLITN
jgi:hypothetical protein